MNTNRLPWLDLETTAISPHQGAAIIEVGVIITDRDLKRIAAERWLVKPPDGARWEMWPLQQHAQSGLLHEAMDQGQPRGVVEAELGQLLDEHFPGCLTNPRARPPLCGNSVHFDRAWLTWLMPDVERRFHHRHIDISSVWLFADHVAALEGAQRPRREVAHTALEDLEACLEDARRYRALMRGEEVDRG